MKIKEPNLNFRNIAQLGNINKINLYYTEASLCSIQDVHDWYTSRKEKGCDYYFIIRKNGTIYRVCLKDQVDFNNNLGICFEENHTKGINDNQSREMQELLKYLVYKRKYTINIFI